MMPTGLLPRLPAAREQADPLAFYRMLEAYYLNNGLYMAFPPGQVLGMADGAGLRALRNPANRAVEFHVTHTWPGSLSKSLPLQGGSPQLHKAIGQIWQWSNWAVKKQLAVRWFALFGDWFCRVQLRRNPAGRAQSVYLQNIKPEHVSDFETDERGNITRIRLDTPASEPGSAGEPYGVGSAGGAGWAGWAGTNAGLAITEVWDKQAGYTRYRGRHLPGTPTSRLGVPEARLPLAAFGIDFVPFVHASFIDTGEKRGMGVFTHALDKIDEVNRMASRLHQLIFRYNRPTLALLANGTDNAGRPLPPPRIAGAASLSDELAADGEIMSLPGTSKVEVLVPPLNYSAHLDAISAMAAELEDDLPELAYYRQRELGSNLSGKAVRLMLAQAVNRTAEARGNLEAALIRAQMMALSMGTQAGLFGGANALGTYAAGNFAHGFAEREVLPLSAEEHAINLAREVSAGVPLRLAAQRQGWHTDEIALLPIQPTQ